MKRAMSEQQWKMVQHRLDTEREKQRRMEEVAICTVCNAWCRKGPDGVWDHIGPCTKKD